MTFSDILGIRLRNQQLDRQRFTQPHELVAWFGAVQAQDYPAAKWGVGQRVRGATAAMLDRAFAEGTILRTHVMRPTWHFVARDDIRWMLSLSAARVTAVLTQYSRRLELDGPTVSRGLRAIATALRKRPMLTRPELAVVLGTAGIQIDSMRLGHLMAHAELASLVCSGAPRGKQQTYALLDERAPMAKTLPREEALAELATRYFSSHGPATLKDYVWWSGLTVKEARTSVEMISDKLTREEANGVTHWWTSVGARRSRSSSSAPRLPRAANLLPNFDEYIVAYADRTAMWDAGPASDPRGNVLFSHTVVMEGRVVGAWKRAWIGDALVVSINAPGRLGSAGKDAIVLAARRYGRFLGSGVTVTFDASSGRASRRASVRRKSDATTSE